MALSEADVRKIAKLARISLTDAEIKKFAVQLENILGYIALLNEVDTENVPVTAQVTHLTNVVRPDEVEQLVSPESLLAASKLPVENNQIMVPSIFDES